MDLSGRVQVRDASGVRNYKSAKDAGDWPLRGVTGTAPMRAVQQDGVSFSSASGCEVGPSGAIVFPTRFGVGGYARNLHVIATVNLNKTTSVSATADVELLDLDGFLALVDPLETGRPSSQTHLEFLASVRKVYQGGAR